MSLSLHFYLLFCVVCLTPMRFPRVKAEGQSFYHCVSRVVDRRFIFQTTGHGSLCPMVQPPSRSLWGALGRAFCSKAARPWPRWLLTSSSTRFALVFVQIPKHKLGY